MPPTFTILEFYKNASMLRQAATRHTSRGSSPKMSLGCMETQRVLQARTHTQYYREYREVGRGETMLSESIHWLQRT